MSRTHGPLFDMLLPRRGFQRYTDDKIRAKLLQHSVISTTHSYEGVLCREWQRATRGDYGQFWNGQRLIGTHVEAFKVFRGPVPDGHHVLHHCDNPPCIEGTHLWTGTADDNMQDKIRKGRSGSHKLIGRKTGPSPQRGDKHALSKLTEAKVRLIRQYATADNYSIIPKHLRRIAGDLNAAALARELEVSVSLVYGVIKGRNWAWIK